MIKVENVTRKYGDFLAVDGVSFEISQGEIVGLLGHNGAGKTTIMKMITGYLEPTSGSITINGFDIGVSRQRIQRNIGYLPENCPVYPEMTTLDYLDFSAAMHGVPAQDRPALIREALTRTALTEKATDQIATLSRGYRQRTGVAQAILHKPAILILDEPTNGLDPTQIQHMRSLISELSEAATIIVSTHILQEVQAICDRVIIMKDGRMALSSRLSDLQRERRLRISTSAENDGILKLFNSFSQVLSVVPVHQRPDSGPIRIFELQLENDTDKDETAAALASTIHQHGWQLFDMHYETRNLETVFAEISQQGGADR